MKRHGDLWAAITSKENIEKAYRRAKLGKSKYGAVKKFEKNIEKNLFNIRRLLVAKKFKTSRYQEKIVLYPKKRIIYILPFQPDRIVQHALMNIVEPIWNKLLMPISFSCRKGMGVHSGSAYTMHMVRKYRYCLKCDISQFYPSINQNILYNIVNRKIKCNDTLWLLDNIIYSYPGGKNVPIGNYTSQWFGNLYMDVVDRWAVHDVKIEGYVRYCDDFCFFSNDKKLLNSIQQELPFFLQEKLRLRLSKCDLFPTSQGVDFLGYRHFPEFKLVRKRVVCRMRRRLRKIYEEIKAGADPELYRSHVSSTYGWLQWANTRNLYNSLKMPYLVRKVGIDVLKR